MDIDIQVCAVYTDGVVRIYSIKFLGRKFLKALKFKTYGAALQFAQEFEDKQRQPILKE